MSLGPWNSALEIAVKVIGVGPKHRADGRGLSVADKIVVWVSGERITYPMSVVR
jgi:hypothetical protein